MLRQFFTVLAFSASTLPAFAEDITITEPDGTQWDSYMVTRDCVLKALEEELGKEMRVLESGNDITGDYQNQTTGLLRSFSVRIHDVDGVGRFAVEGIRHDFSLASPDENNELLAHTQKNGLLAYKESEFPKGDMNNPDNHDFVKIKDGAIAIQYQGETDYDTIGQLKNFDSWLRACLAIG